MKTYTEINVLISQWKAEGLPKGEIIRRTAEACIGWPYVWGGYGQFCTPANRKAYADRGSCSTAEAEQIRKKCQVLNGKKAACGGCKYYPGGRVRFFDCRGFTRWLMQQVGLSLKGAGATSQWNEASNWAEKGAISDLPAGQVCCVFMRDGTKMSHTGMHVGNGIVIHCSGEVKQGKVTDKGWTHYAVPVGLAGETPQPVSEGTVLNVMQSVTERTVPDDTPMLRKGARGEAVREMQEKLIALGYDLGRCGADGIFGRKTLAAVKKFQKANGLKADGICGRITHDCLWQKFRE